MVSTILNAANTPINQNTGTIPNMSDALKNYFQQMMFVLIMKRTVNFQLEESKCKIHFRGVVQPLKARDLNLKPEGQRAWTWLMLHADPVLSLKVDDIVEYNCVKTRVMARTDYKQYGYIYYELVQDWECCT